MNALVAIINHNIKQLTDNLVEQLSVDEISDCELMVLDNGSSDQDQISRHTTHAVDQNTYYGGALQLILDYFLTTSNDYVLIMNNDVIVGQNFVRSMKSAMEQSGYSLLSPCILQPEKNQNYWPTMHSWGSSTIRPVKWVDFCSPILSRELVTHIGSYDMDLRYGWGNDVEAGRIANENNLLVGVVDYIPIIHLSEHTYKSGKSDLTREEYGNLAMSGMVKYFDKIGHTATLNEYRNWARNYSFPTLDDIYRV